MRIDSGDGSLLNRIRERGQPPIRLPFVRIGTPQCRIRIAIKNRYDYVGVFRNDDLMHLTPVGTYNRGGKREGNVFLGSDITIVSCSKLCSSVGN